MRERAKEIIAGIAILEYLINPQVTKIGIEDNKPEAIAALQQATENTHIQVVVFPTKYPSGGEKQLIQILTGKEVPTGGLPADIGIVCQNIGTTVAIHRAIHYGEPLISRITTITGDACTENKNLEVLLGTPIQFLLDQCGFEKKICSRLIMGGPMMGFTLESTATPVVKTTNCILAPSKKEIPTTPPAQACIRCGQCAEACPASLLPQQMYWFARGGEWEKLEAHNLMDCIECGACSYVCPSNIPLVQYYRASKVEIRQQKQNALQAEQSKIRFEARQERIERQEAEKEAKRKARKKAAEARAAENAKDNNEADPIQAAIERAKAKKSAADPALAAIERAKAKRADGGTEVLDKTTLEQHLATAEKRLRTAKEKLQQAQEQGSDKIDAFKLGVEKSTEKFQSAKAALDQYTAKNQSSGDTQPSNQKMNSTNDAAQQAIINALKKREAASSMTDEERLINAVSALQKRVEKSKQKLIAAREANDENLSIFESSVVKLEEKLNDAEQALADHNAGEKQ